MRTNALLQTEVVLGVVDRVQVCCRRGATSADRHGSMAVFLMIKLRAQFQYHKTTGQAMQQNRMNRTIAA